MRRRVMVTIWLCLLCISVGLLDSYLIWQNKKELQEVEKQIMTETIPGIREFHDVAVGGVVFLEDVGYGEVNIGIGSAKNRSAVLYFWTNDEQPSVTALRIGDKVVFGGYNIELCSIYYKGSLILEIIRIATGHHPTPGHVILKTSLVEGQR